VAYIGSMEVSVNRPYYSWSINCQSIAVAERTSLCSFPEVNKVYTFSLYLFKFYISTQPSTPFLRVFHFQFIFPSFPIISLARKLNGHKSDSSDGRYILWNSSLCYFLVPPFTTFSQVKILICSLWTLNAREPHKKETKFILCLIILKTRQLSGSKRSTLKCVKRTQHDKIYRTRNYRFRGEATWKRRLCRVVLCRVVWCVVSCRAVPCRVLFRVAPCLVVLCCAVSCRVVLCCVLSCRVVLCCVASCRVVSSLRKSTARRYAPRTTMILLICLDRHKRGSCRPSGWVFYYLILVTFTLSLSLAGIAQSVQWLVYRLDNKRFD
jgi:hypothetical protein